MSELAKGLYSTAHRGTNNSERQISGPLSSGSISSRQLEQLKQDKYVQVMHKYLVETYGLKLTYNQYIGFLIRMN